MQGSTLNAELTTINCKFETQIMMAVKNGYEVCSMD